MGKRDFFTRLLAILGVLAVWLVLLAPVLFSAMRFVQSRQFLFDYLMPAELFPVVLIGGLLLFWAALRAKSHSRVIAWGLLIAIAMLGVGQAYAVLSGLAHGDAEPTGLPWMLVLGSIALYTLGVLITGIGGLKLLGVLNKNPELPA